MPTAYQKNTQSKPLFEDIRYYPGAMTNPQFMMVLLELLQPSPITSKVARPLELSEEATAALGEHNAERFTELSMLKDGWHFGQGKTLQSASLRSMELFLAQYHSFPERCSLFLSEQGNLELVWRSEKNETTSLEFYEDHIEYYLETLDEEGKVAIRDLSTLVQKLAHA
jgi:hypothetical protein